MTDIEMLEHIAHFGYGVYRVGSQFAIADPQDDEDGFYLTVNSIAEGYREMMSAELLTEQ